LTDALTNQFQSNPAGYTIPPHGSCWSGRWKVISEHKTQPELHVDFKLDKGGEAIVYSRLTAPAIDAITFGAQTRTSSEGRYLTGTTFRSFMTSTPRTNNSFQLTADACADCGSCAGRWTDAFFRPARVTAISLPTLRTACPGAPSGAGINSGTGRSMESLQRATNNISIIVADNGSPSLSATQTLQSPFINRRS